MRWLFLCVSFWSLSALAQVARPILILPTTGEFFNDPLVRGFFADILRQGGYGHWKTERAAFIVVDDQNRYRCVAWPFDGRLYRQQFQGAIPAGAIAIIHTHPSEIPDASQGDKETARRLLIPIFVLTPLNIELITDRGVAVPIVRNRPWCEVKRASHSGCEHSP